MTNYLVDIDGTICQDIANEDRHLFASAQPLPLACENMHRLLANGKNNITYFTAREERDRAVTLEWLKQHGFPCWNQLVMGKPRSKGYPNGYMWIDNTPVRGHTFTGHWDQ